MSPVSSASFIHPTAVIASGARLGSGCRVGPHVVIDPEVQVGDGCELGPGVYLTGSTQIGPRNRFHAGAVIGDAPQDAKYDGRPTRLIIGSDNVFREHVTVHRSNRDEEDTRIGDGNLFMAGSHVGHNCQIGHQNIVANGALLAGHVILADRAFISGTCLVHQHCRIGRLALMQGGAGISKDLPPFCVATGANEICGLNTIGLRRAGLDASERLALKRAYHRLFRSGQSPREALAAVRSEFGGLPAVTELVDFIAQSRRGVCSDTSFRPSLADPDAP
jgi:UDP-N-acetylglucosamine acyltransferase